MNAISLYVSTSRIVLQNDSDANDQKIADLYRLVPYLRQSMSCAVCGRLLKDPFTPKEAKCQHNVCRLCVRGRKNIRPTCNSCRDCQDYRTYEENKQMRILIQCYKSLCEHIMSTPLYGFICKQSMQTSSVVNGIVIPNLSLVELIEEGANFEDIFMAFTTELPRSYAKVLPAIVTSVPANQPSPALGANAPQLPLIIKQEFPLIDMSRPMVVTQTPTSTLSFLNNSPATISTTSTSLTVANSSLTVAQVNKTPNFVTQHRNVITSAPVETKSVVMTPAGTATTQIRNPPPIKTVSNGTAMYSVLYTGIGNKITIKRKTDADEENSPRKTVAPTLFRQVTKQNAKRRGCRCGNATATPGKLTCCGQRCPCYVDSKSCIGCKCRGCRNPHRPDGGKVRPIIPELACYEIHMADESSNLNTSDLPITKDLITTTKNLAPVSSFHNRKEYPLNEYPVTSRITVTPVMSSTTSTIAHRNQNLHQPQQSVKQSQTFTSTNKVQRDSGVVQLENLSKESLLIQSPEGKYQVVNVFTSTSHQNQPGIQRIHSISHNNSGNTFILPNSNSQISTTIHQIPEISTTLPQIIMQQQSQQQLPSNNKPPISTQVSTFSKHNNLITVHTVPPHSGSQSKNSAISLSTTPATFTLSPIIVTSPSSFTSELFQDDDFLSSSHTATGNSPLSISHPPLLEVVDASDL